MTHRSPFFLAIRPNCPAWRWLVRWWEKRRQEGQIVRIKQTWLKVEPGLSGSCQGCCRWGWGNGQVQIIGRTLHNSFSSNVGVSPFSTTFDKSSCATRLFLAFGRGARWGGGWEGSGWVRVRWTSYADEDELTERRPWEGGARWKQETEVRPICRDYSTISKDTHCLLKSTKMSCNLSGNCYLSM